MRKKSETIGRGGEELLASGVGEKIKTKLRRMKTKMRKLVEEERSYWLFWFKKKN